MDAVFNTAHVYTQYSYKYDIYVHMHAYTFILVVCLIHGIGPKSLVQSRLTV